MALTKIKADGLTADLIDETKLADNSIDSEHYNDGSIDNAHLADDQITNAKVNSSAAIAGSKISPDFGSQNVVSTGTSNALGTTTIKGGSNAAARLLLQNTTSVRTNYIGLSGDDDRIVIAADDDDQGSNSTIDFKVDGSEKLKIESGTTTIKHSNDSGATTLKLENNSTANSTDPKVQIAVDLASGKDGGSIEFIRESNYQSSAAADSAIVINPTKNDTNQEAVRITQDWFRLHSNCSGIQFNSDTASANALNDYEEGTWTPDWRGASALGTTSYGTYNAGSYVKIGNQVTVRGHTHITGSSGGSGFWFINNLPFTNGGGDDRRYRTVGSVMIETFDLPDDVLDVVCFIERNNNDMQIRGNRDNAGASSNISVNNDTDFDIFWTVTYQTA